MPSGARAHSVTPAECALVAPAVCVLVAHTVCALVRWSVRWWLLLSVFVGGSC